MVTINHGSFILSLDFELMWGVRDHQTIQSYGTNIAGVQSVIPRLLELFESYHVQATFATVGFLFFKSKTDLLNNLPCLKPNYVNEEISPYKNDYINKLKETDNYHFASNLIELLKSKPFIEIATHTFSHYYCWEEGQSAAEFEADIQAAVKTAMDHGVVLKSIIFPRNQVSADYMNVCARYGITTYRGNPSAYFNPGNQMKDRFLRLIDTYLPVGSETVYSYHEIEEKGIYNIKASRFLRSYSSKLALLEGLKLKRIKDEMTLAANQKKVYHLWWHPHNFGANQKQNFNLLEDILKHFREISDKYEFKSYTMSGLTELLTKK